MSNRYNKREHYNANLLKGTIISEGHDSPTRYIEDLLVVAEGTAKKKVQTGTFSPDEMWLVGNSLNLDDETFMRIFFPNMRV